MKTYSLLNRREFIGRTGNLALFLLAESSLLAGYLQNGPREFLFLEAEGFDDLGGWDLDQQSMDQMGSPYLLAHGLGVPVLDAVTEAEFPSAGTYRVWVRTRDWVAPWRVSGAPGKFQLLVNGRPLAAIFGTEGADWHWQDGGMVTVKKINKLALHDLTGFEGRCEAILFCKDLDFVPTNELGALTKFRRKLLGLSERPDDGGAYDFVVVGGGLAGTCAALSAARNGLKVALVQDRPVLGGNGSAEVRVWPEGKTGFDPYPHLGDIVNEIVPEKKSGNAKAKSAYGDPERLAVVRREPRIKLLLEHRSCSVEMSGASIAAVVVQSTRSGRRTRLAGNFFADCTGDASVGFMAGADFEVSQQGHQGMSNLWNVLDSADKRQVLKCECKDKTALVVSCEIGKVEQPFPRCPWAIDLGDKPFPGRKNFKGQWGGKNPLDNLGGWFWESGFDMDPIADVERIRDLNLRAMYGAWDALKNVDKLYPNHRLGWAAFIAGKRESRRLLGDIILGVEDFRRGKAYPDGCFPCTWHIDLHAAYPEFSSGLESEAFISKATTGSDGYKYPYWAPYRCLYSRNIPNLFMAGRDISVTHEGLGPVRVMKTCGMMGEIVGKAVAICLRHDVLPRGVYEQYLPELQAMMKESGTKRV